MEQKLSFSIEADASKLTSAFREAASSVDSFESKISQVGKNEFGKEIEESAEKVEESLEDAGKAAEEFDNKISKVGSGAGFEKLAGQIESISGKFKSIGTGLTIAAAPFELFAAQGISAFSNFETKMSEVFTLLPGISGEAMSQMSDQVREFAVTFGTDITNTQTALYNALSAGVPQEDIFNFLETANQAALGGVTDINTAVGTLTGAVNAYREQGLTAQEASDSLLTTVRLGKTTFDELGSSIGDVSPSASALGVDFNELTAAIATSTLVTGNTSKSVTGLKNLFTELSKSGSEGLGKLFNDLNNGEDFYTFIQNGGSLADALNMIREYADASGVSINSLAGSSEAAGAVLQLTGDNAEVYANNLDEMNKSMGATAKAAEILEQTMGHSLGKVKSSFADISIEVGEKLAPVVEDFANWLSSNAGTIKEFAGNVVDAAVPAIKSLLDIVKDLMSSFNNMNPETKEMLAKLFGIGVTGAAVGGPALLGAGFALGPIASMVQILGGLGKLTIPATVATEIGAIGTAAGTATPLLSGMFGLLANPVTLAAGAGLIAAYATNLGDFRDNVNGIFKEISEAAQHVSTGDYEAAGRDMAQAVAKGFETVGDLIIKGIPQAEQVFNGFKSATGDFFKGIGAEGMRMLQEGLNSATISATDLITKLGADITSFDWKSLGSDIGAKLIEGLSNPVGTLTGFYNSVKASLESMNWASIGASLASSALKGFVPGLQNNPVGAFILESLGIGAVEQYAKGDQKPGTTYAPGISLGPNPNALTIDVTGKLALPETEKTLAEMVAEERDISVKDAQKMLDGSDTFREKQEKKFNAPQPVVITTPQGQPAGPSTSSPSADTVTLDPSQFKSFEAYTDELIKTRQSTSSAADSWNNREVGSTPSSREGFGSTTTTLSRFELDPAQYFKDDLKTVLQNFDGNIETYENYLKEYGQSLETKARQVFRAGTTGNMNEDEWVRSALAPYQKTGLSSAYEKAVKDGNVSLSDAVQYLGAYNTEIGKKQDYTQQEIHQTRNLMDATMQLSGVQSLYNNYMSDGVLDATEAASVQQALASATKMMGDAGITAEGGISGLPGALQALAGAAQSAMAAIQAAIGQAQSAVAQAQDAIKMQSVAGRYQPMQGSQTSQMSDSPYNQSININMNNNTFPTGTNPGEVFANFVNGTRVIGV